MTTLNTDRNPAPEPGFHFDMSFPVYRDAPGINASVLKEGRTSMKHLCHALANPKADTPAMKKGRAMHTALFEASQFQDRYAIWEGDNRRTKAYKEWEAQQTKETLTIDEAEEALEAGQEAVKHPLVQEVIAEGRAEVSVFGDEDGNTSKARVDWLCGPDYGWNAIVDLKTAANIQRFEFGRQFERLGYQISLGWYRRRVREHIGKDLPVYVIALENHPPYDVVRVPVPEAVLDLGEAQCVEILKHVKACKEASRWPGICEDDDYDLWFPEHAMPEEEVTFDG